MQAGRESVGETRATTGRPGCLAQPPKQYYQKAGLFSTALRLTIHQEPTFLALTIIVTSIIPSTHHNHPTSP
ncbi:MAG: hypothetical protein ACYC56_13585 [Candidatus Aquicultor sp.]